MNHLKRAGRLAEPTAEIVAPHGAVNKTTGEAQGALKGDAAGNAFTDSAARRIQGTQVSGTWSAKNQYCDPTGT